MVLDEKEYFISSHCICIIFALNEISAKELNQKLAEFEQRKDNDKQTIRIDEKFKLKNDASGVKLSYSCAKDLFSENYFKLTANMTSIGKITVATANKEISAFDYFCSILQGVNATDIIGTSCTKFYFGLDKFVNVGGLSIPITIELSPEIKEKIGDVQIGGFKLRFDNSPIGVDEVEIEIINKDLVLSTSIDYKLSSLEDIGKKSFKISKDIANLLVKNKQ